MESGPVGVGLVPVGSVNAVVERFFGRLEHDWILKIHQPIRAHMKKDVAVYMKYYDTQRLHTANGDLSPMQYENSLVNVSMRA